LARLGLDAIGGAGSISQYRVPEDNMYSVQPDPWMMIVSFDVQLPALHSFIWEDN